MLREIDYKDIHSLDTLERLQESLHALTGLAFGFVDIDGKHGQGGAKYEVELCRLVNKTHMGREACRQGGAGCLRECLATKKPLVQACHLGLTDVLVPLVVREKVIGMLTAGQFLMEAPNQEDLQKIMERLEKLKINISNSQAQKYIYELPVCSRQKIDAVISLLMEFSVYVTDAEHRLMLLKQHSQMDGVNLAINFIQSRFQEHLSLKDVAAAAHISSSHLRKLFHEKIGISPMAYLNDYRLNISAELLAQTNIQVIQVAYQIGFESVSHFNHLFKRRFGKSPSKYRKAK
jgi:AraC-like DNA-binding protein/ligand-binding sensor protein